MCTACHVAVSQRLTKEQVVVRPDGSKRNDIVAIVINIFTFLSAYVIGLRNSTAGIAEVSIIEAMLHICMQRTMDEFRRIKKENEGDMPSDDE